VEKVARHRRERAPFNPLNRRCLLAAFPFPAAVAAALALERELSRRRAREIAFQRVQSAKYSMAYRDGDRERAGDSVRHLALDDYRRMTSARERKRDRRASERARRPTSPAGSPNAYQGWRNCSPPTKTAVALSRWIATSQEERRLQMKERRRKEGRKLGGCAAIDSACRVERDPQSGRSRKPPSAPGKHAESANVHLPDKGEVSFCFGIGGATIVSTREAARMTCFG
jgi:hypothetical protein